MMGFYSLLCSMRKRERLFISLILLNEIELFVKDEDVI
jgi:hypothetical protein